MKAVIQRVTSSSVKVDNEIISKISNGLLILLGITHNDSQDDIEKLADKIVNLRIFPDDKDKLNLSLLDISGELLVVSQFTLYSDTRKGRRPSFVSAAPPNKAEKLYNDFCTYIATHSVKVHKGCFGKHMDVELCNSGPVTLIIDTENDL